MAGADFVDITLRGRGGHGALPQTTRDPVVALGALIQAVQGIVGRNVDPLRSGVVSITRIRGGDAYNVIPGEASCRGTIRALDDETRALMRDSLRRIAEGVAPAHEVEGDIRDIFTVRENCPGPTARWPIARPSWPARISPTCCAMCPAPISGWGSGMARLCTIPAMSSMTACCRSVPR